MAVPEADVTPGLSAFLRAAARRPFSWGSHDCLMWLSGWVAMNGRGDPGHGWRRYRSAFGAARLIAEAGGVVEHMERCLAPLGIERTNAPRRGDIAAVTSEAGIVGAIVVSSNPTRRSAPLAPPSPQGAGMTVIALVACLTAQGVSVASRPLVAVWRV